MHRWLLPLLALSACKAAPQDTAPVAGVDDTGTTVTDTDPGTHEDTGTPTDTSDTGTPQDTDETHPAAGPIVILFIGDGMGFEHVAGGGIEGHGASGTLTMETAPVQGSILTASLTGYTDSAAAGSTMATGNKTWNGVLGLDRDLLPVENLLELAASKGMGTGVVTTDTLTGATPSAFLTHLESRVDKFEIALQISENVPDVLMGGGAAEFVDRLDPTLYTIVETGAELAAVTDEGLPLVGLFADSTLPFVADGYEGEPTLAEMTSAALDRLETNEKGFVLMVEGARIDHASHMNLTDAVYLEVDALDEAVAMAVSRAEGWTDREVTILVTADHECGGLHVEEDGAEGEAPPTSWRWGDHTNADVPVYAWGDKAAVLDGQRLDNLWIHAVLEAALRQEDVVTPTVPRLPDGELSDLGDQVTVQTVDTDYGAGFNQLDALRVAADYSGLWVGVDGVFDDAANTVTIWLDLDYGQGTGVGQDLTLADEDGLLDRVASALIPAPEIDGLGFDAVVGQMSGTYLRYGDKLDEAGLRLFDPPSGNTDDIWWMDAVINFEDGNLAYHGAAADAGATGATLGGMEILLPWDSLFPDGLPPEGSDIALWATLVNTMGEEASNQALPPYADGTAPSATEMPVSSVVLLTIDADGVNTSDPTTVP